MGLEISSQELHSMSILGCPPPAAGCCLRIASARCGRRPRCALRTLWWRSGWSHAGTSCSQHGNEVLVPLGVEQHSCEEQQPLLHESAAGRAGLVGQRGNETLSLKWLRRGVHDSFTFWSSREQSSMTVSHSGAIGSKVRQPFHIEAPEGWLVSSGPHRWSQFRLPSPTS